LGTACSQRRRLSEGYRHWEAAGLAADETGSWQSSQQPSARSSFAAKPPGDSPAAADGLGVGPAAREQEGARHKQQLRAALHQHQQAAAELAGGDQRFSPRAKAEGAAVLDLLCCLVLTQQQADQQGLRYLRWACRYLQVRRGGGTRRGAACMVCDSWEGRRLPHVTAPSLCPLMQGGRVKPSSPFYDIHLSAGLALRRARQHPASRAAHTHQEAGEQPGSRRSGAQPRATLLSLGSLARAAGAVMGGSRTAAGAP
jgi:hypothetical protein